MIEHNAVVNVIVECIRQLNLARTKDKQLEEQPHAAIFGGDSPLDSLGLVALVIDVEQALADEGCQVLLSDEKTMSQRNSPFKTVDTLANYIQERMSQENAG